MVLPSDGPTGVRGTTPLQTDSQAKGRRFQFRLSMLFFCILVVAVATQQILSPHWTEPERWLLAGWFIGWLGGLTYSRARGKRGILAATVAGTLCGFTAALALYTGFADHVRKRTLPFRDEVIYPLMGLFLLALVSSAALAAAYHVTAFVVRKHLRRVQDDFASRRLVRAWLATGITAVPVAALLASWVALLFAWRPVATLDIRHAYDGSGPGVAFSPDNKLLALGTGIQIDNLGSIKGFVELWELPALKRSARHDADLVNRVSFVEFSGDGRRLACGSVFDPRVRVIGVDSGESQVEVDVTLPFVSAIAFADQALAVIASSANNKLAISLWDQATGARTQAFRVDVPGWAPAVHVKRGLFAYLHPAFPLGGPSRIALHALNDGRHLANGPIVPRASSVRPCFSHNGDWVCMANVVWNHQTGESHQMPGHGMGFLPDGRLIIVQTGMAVGMPVSWWRPIWLYRTPILRRFVIPRPWSRVAIYDVQTRRILRTSATQDGGWIAWISPDGTTMATLGSKRELKIWRVPSEPSWPL